jgi:hypothetical protein
LTDSPRSEPHDDGTPGLLPVAWVSESWSPIANSDYGERSSSNSSHTARLLDSPLGVSHPSAATYVAAVRGGKVYVVPARNLANGGTSRMESEPRLLEEQRRLAHESPLPPSLLPALV